MLFYLMYLPNLLFNLKQETTSEMGSFYLCTRNEILDLNKISQYGNLLKIENLDCESFNDFFKDFYIKKISYEINFKEKLFLEAQNFYQNNVFYIEISRKRTIFKNFTDSVNFYLNSKPLKAFNPIDCFDNDVYIVESNDDFMKKMKLTLEYARLSNEILRAERKISKLFNFIEKILIYDSVKEKNLKKEFYYQQLETKIEILFFLIKKSNLVANLDNIYYENEESLKNFMIFNKRKLKNKIDYKRSIIKRIIIFLNDLMLSISIDHKLEPNRDLLKTVNSVKSMLELTIKGFCEIHKEITEFADCETQLEDSVMSILTLDFFDKYLNYRSTFDKISFSIKKDSNYRENEPIVGDPWNILSFSDCFLNYIENLKKFLENFKKTREKTRFSLNLFSNGAFVKFYEQGLDLFWSEHEEVINQSLVSTNVNEIVNHDIDFSNESYEDELPIICSE